MCIVFTCGEHTFRKEVEGYEGIVCRCYNCGNYAGHVIKSHPWFTFCFIVSVFEFWRVCYPWGENPKADDISIARCPSLNQGLRRRIVPHLQFLTAA